MAAALDQQGDGSSGNVGNLPGDNLNGQVIRVFPNPTAGKLVVEFSGYAVMDAEISVYDFQNKLLFTRACKTLQTEIDLSGFENGVYLMYIKVEGTMSSWKVIKQ